MYSALKFGTWLLVKVICVLMCKGLAHNSCFNQVINCHESTWIIKRVCSYVGVCCDKGMVYVCTYEHVLVGMWCS